MKSLFLLGLVFATFLVGCASPSIGPRVFYSIATPAGSGTRPRVYVAAVSNTRTNQPIAMTVFDPVSGRALDTFPLTKGGHFPCGIWSANSAGNPVSYVTVDDRYIPFDRWEEAATGQSQPYRIRISFRSDQGVIWEADVMARYSGCGPK